MDENHTVSLLNEEIEFIEAEKFANKFDHMMNGKLKRKIKRVIKILLPIFCGMGLLFLFPSKITFIILCLTSLTTISVDFIKNNILPLKNNKSNIIKLNDYKKSIAEDYFDELLKESERKKSHDEYLRDNHGFNIFSNEDIDNFDLKEQNTTEWITCETAINTVLKNIELFSNLYNIPPLIISDKEWDMFFDKLCSEFIKRELSEDFFESIDIITRYTLAKSLVYEYKNLYITDFIQNIIYLDKKYNLLDTKITKRDVLNIQKELLAKFKEINNVVEFSRIRKNIGK